MSAQTVLQQENAELRRALNAGAETHYEDMRRIRELENVLQTANALVKVARQHFPKSIHHGDRFQLENTSAAIGTALLKVTP